MAYQTIQVERRDDVEVITLNRPDRMNAWTYEMAEELAQAINAANDADEVGAMVLTGAGRGFCAGADVEAVFKAQAEGAALSRTEDAQNWVNQVRASKPIIAAVNGAAIGLGLTLILPLDYLMASHSAKLSLRFVKMGVVPELASSRFLFARVRFGQASELMLSGRTVSADEALELGLVDKVVADEALLDEAVQLARTMGANPRAGVRMIKELITANASETDLDEVQRREGRALKEAYETPEHREAIAAFLDKREPDFQAARQRG